MQMIKGNVVYTLVSKEYNQLQLIFSKRRKRQKQMRNKENLGFPQDMLSRTSGHTFFTVQALRII